MKFLSFKTVSGTSRSVFKGWWIYWAGCGAVLLVAGILWQSRIHSTNPLAADTEPDQVGLFRQIKGSLNTALGEQVASQLRTQAENALLQTNLPNDAIITRLFDDSTPMATRRLDARRLASRTQTDASRSALLGALYTGNPELRAAVAEALGFSHWPEALSLLQNQLAERDAVVLAGVVRGLALIGDNSAVQLLRELLENRETPGNVRAEVAIRLGDVGTPAAFEVLKSAAGLPLPPDVLSEVVASLGKYPFQDIREVFQNVLANPANDVTLKADAVEALIATDREALPFLLETAASSPDADVRAAAAWAAGNHPDTGNAAENLAQSLAREPETDVRRRIYEALQRQDNIPARQVADQALAETDPAARIAGANTLAIAIAQGDAEPAEQDRFDRILVPHLETTALGTGNLNLRMRAVFALGRAGTGQSVESLDRISADGDPAIAAVASRNLARITLSSRLHP